MKGDYYSNQKKGSLGPLAEYYRKEAERYEGNFKSILDDFGREAKCLDLGCGIGNFTAFLIQSGFQSVAGVDSSSNSIEICKESFPKATFWLEDIHEFMAHNREKFSIVTMFSLLEHIEKHRLLDTLSQIRETLLEPGGMFLFSTPNMDTLIGNTAGRYGDFTHETGFTPDSLRQVLEDSGFREIRVFGNRYAGNSIFKKLMRRAYQPAMIFLLRLIYHSMDQRFPEIPGNVLYGFAKK